MEVVTLRSADAIGSLREEWLDLAAELPHSSYFQTPDWVLSWWETVGGQPYTQIATWRDDAGRLEGISLLSQVSQPLHRLFPLAVRAWINTGSGPGAADHCGWLALPHRSAAVEKWTFREATSTSVLLQNLDPEVGAELPAPARAVWQTESPRFLITPGSGQVGRSANFRQQLRSTERKLRAAGVSLRWVDPLEMNEDVLQALVALHQSRWKTRRRRSNFTPEDLGLHRRLIEMSGPGRGPAAVVAEHAGRCIGVLYGFWWRDEFAYYQMGWDPAWAHYRPGIVLLREGIRMAACRGGRVFDFLRGTEPVKYRFGVQERNDTSWLIARGWSGHALSLSFAARRLVRLLRARAPST
jgi:CelD/BcsL family acetyltransferase involved in cellulose biosynthesis